MCTRRHTNKIDMYAHTHSYFRGMAKVSELREMVW